jgi:CubicO group peptidase (beta-lactamase class C family)
VHGTVPARRPITVRHLATLTCGWGTDFRESPLKAAMVERGIFPGQLTPLTTDEYIARVAELPLAFHPGEGWLYDTGINVLGVLLARATATSLPELLAQRITGPLGMASTAFWTTDTERLTTAYEPTRGGGLRVRDPPDGHWASEPSFPKLSAGLLSTAGDLLRFFTALADGGAPVLTPDSVALMTSDALDDVQRAQAATVVRPGGSWGIATGVDIEAAEPWMAPGRWGWEGGSGTTAHADPTRDTVGVLLTQRRLAGPNDGFGHFWAAVAAA